MLAQFNPRYGLPLISGVRFFKRLKREKEHLKMGGGIALEVKYFNRWE